MIDCEIIIPQRIHRRLYEHLFDRSGNEQVVFLFASTKRTESSAKFLFKDLYWVQPDEYAHQSPDFVELKDEMRPKIIKKASDLRASLIEIHSHRLPADVRFSPSDIQGLKEFVPHVWWRLKGRPYAAVVFSKSDFDGLVWIDNPFTTYQLERITIRGLLKRRRLYSTGFTLKEGLINEFKAS